MSDDQQHQTGQDSRVEDWFGQSVQRDRDLVDELTAGDIDDEQAEREFADRATGEAEQKRRHGDTIDPDQGRSAYRNKVSRDNTASRDDAPADERAADERAEAASVDPDSPGATIDDPEPAEPNEPG